MRTRLFLKLTLLGLLLGVVSGTRALAEDADALRHLRVDDYFALKSVGSPRISPDGAWVAYTVRTKDLENDRSETRLWMVPTAGGEALPMTAGAQRLLFASTCSDPHVNGRLAHWRNR